jgi:hypothetical protein
VFLCFQAARRRIPAQAWANRIGFKSRRSGDVTDAVFLFSQAGRLAGLPTATPYSTSIAKGGNARFPMVTSTALGPFGVRSGNRKLNS